MRLGDLFGRQYYEIELNDPITPFRDGADFVGSLVALRLFMQEKGCSEEEIRQAREEVIKNAKTAHPEWGWCGVER